MDAPFKVGDWVECIRANRFLTKGKTYKIDSIYLDDDKYFVTLFELNLTLYADRFRLEDTPNDNRITRKIKELEQRFQQRSLA